MIMTWPTLLWETGIIKSTFFMTRKLGHLRTKWTASDNSYCSEIRKVLHDLTWRNRVGKHLCRQINNRNTSYVTHTNTVFPWGKKINCLNFLGGKRHISYPPPHTTHYLNNSQGKKGDVQTHHKQRVDGTLSPWPVWSLSLKHRPPPSAASV